MPEPKQIEDHGPDAHRQNITQRGGELGAADRCAEFGDLVTAGIATIAADDIGQRSPGHGRLLGGQGKTKDLQQQETDGVVSADKNRFHKGRPVLADKVKFNRRGKDGKKSAADGRTPHLPVFPAAVGNIVFAAMAGSFHCLARQQVEVLPDERGDARILKQAAH